MSMQPGRKLDALVAEVVMGNQIKNGIEFPKGELSGGVTLTRYSTSWEGMRLVVERMREMGFCFQVTQDSKWDAGFMNKEQEDFWSGDSDIAPHAVCLAALAAIEGGVKLP